jgi:hypothetical protein
MQIDFELNTIDNFLKGIDHSDCIAENVKTGEMYETKSISIGFLFFSVHFHFKPTT